MISKMLFLVNLKEYEKYEEYKIDLKKTNNNKYICACNIKIGII